MKEKKKGGRTKGRTHGFDVVVLERPERSIGLSKDSNLLVVESLLDIGTVGEFEESPAGGGGGGVLAGHEKSDPVFVRERSGEGQLGFAGGNE